MPMSREDLPLLCCCCLGWRSDADLWWWLEYKSSGMENTFWTGGAETGGPGVSDKSPFAFNKSFNLAGVPRRARREEVVFVFVFVFVLVLMSGVVVVLTVVER